MEGTGEEEATVVDAGPDGEIATADGTPGFDDAVPAGPVDRSRTTRTPTTATAIAAIARSPAPAVLGRGCRSSAGRTIGRAEERTESSPQAARTPSLGRSPVIR